MKWILGKTLDNYLIQKVLGKGGMGLVFKALDKNLDMVVAIKLMDPALSQDEVFIKRFREEAKALAKLQSSNIVRVLAMRESEYGLYIVMEFVDGNTLADRIFETGQIPWREASPIIQQLLAAIGHAHRVGVLHLDLKPQNIMLTGNNLVKVTDFGLAKLQRDSKFTTSTFNAGTLAYMSPEHLKGRSYVDHRSDIYTIGITLYEMLTGRTPFEKSVQNYDIQKDIMEGKVPSIREYNAAIPPALASIVMKAIEKIPDQRFQSTEEMLQEIQIFEKGEALESLGSEEAQKQSVISAPAERIKAKTINILKPFQLRIPTPRQEISRTLKNPYSNRGEITIIEEFYGRRTEIMKIYSRIGGARPQSVSLIGEPRTGKSSLLHFIIHPANRLQYLNYPDKYIFVLIDLRRIRVLYISDIFEAIYSELLKEFNGGLELNAQPNYDGIKKVVAALNEEGYKLILVFDEFENITQNTNFDKDFYAFYRSIASNYNVGYLVTSRRNLQSLCHNEEISNSPFFNIFSNINLGQFSHQEALELTRKPARAVGFSMDPYVSFILDVAGYLPFFIQMVCALIFEYLKQNKPLTSTSYKKIKEAFETEARDYFQQIWDNCEEEKREILQSLSQSNLILPEKEYALRDLLREGYVKISDGKSAVFSSVFEEYIIQRTIDL